MDTVTNYGLIKASVTAGTAITADYTRSLSTHKHRRITKTTTSWPQCKPCAYEFCLVKRVYLRLCSESLTVAFCTLFSGMTFRVFWQRQSSAFLMTQGCSLSTKNCECFSNDSRMFTFYKQLLKHQCRFRDDHAICLGRFPKVPY